MDMLEFLQRSEWPVLIGGALWYFRKPLYRLLDYIRPTKVSAWGVSIELALEKAEALTAATRAETKDEQPKQLGTQKTRDHQFQLEADELRHPQLVVLTEWNTLEAAIYNAAERGRFAPPRVGYLAMRQLETMAKEVGFTLSEIEAIKELRKVRNRVAHELDFPLSKADAVRFSELVRGLISRLRSLEPEVAR